MSNEFTMLFILDPGDCETSSWVITNQATPPQSIGTITKIKAGVFKWTYSSNSLSISVKVTGPTWDDLTVKPAGMAGLVNEGISSGSTDGLLPRWYSLAPYQPMFYNGTNSLTLERANSDHVYHNTFYPTWMPDRAEDGARAVLFAPGFHLFDLGEIQSVTKQYHANNTVIPIMCYGYRRSFVMDLGTTMSVSLKYIRVQPDDFNDASGDSRRWSNGKWLAYLRSLMDRWQMKTNGQVLYLLNPKNTQSRLSTTATKEIIGANCYISSAPINYADMGPHAISGSMELQMGTLYPKKETPVMRKIYFRLGGTATSVWPNPNYYREMEYPVGSVLRLPEFYWDKTRPIVNNVYSYIKCWSISANGTDWHNPGDIVYVDDVTRVVNGEYTIYAITESVDISSLNSILYNGPGSLAQTSDFTSYFEVSLLPGFNSATVEMVAVGGGGGGSSGCRAADTTGGTGHTSFHYDTFAGGGGGSAGGKDSSKTGQNAYVINKTTRFNFTLGGGGAGGVGSTYTLPNGDDNTGRTKTNYDTLCFNAGSSGNSTTIYVGTTRLAYGKGGNGSNNVIVTEETFDHGVLADVTCIVKTVDGGGAGSSPSAGDSPGTGGDGGTISSPVQGRSYNWEPDPVPNTSLFCFVIENGDNGAGTNPGTGGALNGYTSEEFLTEQHGSTKYYDLYKMVGSGGGGGGSHAESTPTRSYGGAGASMLTSYSDNLSLRHGSWGGGGGGGAAIFSITSSNRTVPLTAGGTGGRGYIWVSVTGGIISRKGWT